MSKYLLILGVLGVLFSCNLEQEIDLNLPVYEEKIIVEAYLQPGEPYRVLVTRSSSYFDPFPTNLSETFQNLLVNDARVSISYNGNTVQLSNFPGISQNNNKIFNYISGQTATFDTINPYELFIELENGETIESSTTFLPVIPIDSIVFDSRVESDDSTKVRMLTYFNDRPEQANFFRRTLYAFDNGALEERQDFTSDDRFVEDIVVFGTGYDFSPGDTVINRIYNIEEKYYNFLTSVGLAIDANGNPFGQPSPIIPAVGGTADALGIFTALSFVEERSIVEE